MDLRQKEKIQKCHGGICLSTALFAGLYHFPFCHVGLGLWISFNSWKLTTTMKFVGLNNYIRIFSDGFFTSSLWYTLRFVLISTPIFMILCFLIAYLIESNMNKHKGLFRTAIFAPLYLVGFPSWLLFGVLCLPPIRDW